MKLKLLVPLLPLLFFACKTQEKKETQEYESISAYQPNPDEVVVNFEWKANEESNGSWAYQVEVVKQLKAGFGYKKRLSAGEVISFTSNTKIEQNSNYCVFEYQIAPGSDGNYTFKTFLKN